MGLDLIFNIVVKYAVLIATNFVTCDILEIYVKVRLFLVKLYVLI